jgi:hypothetical protein
MGRAGVAAAECGGWPTFGALPPHTRLALEIAAHEEQERRVLTGELGKLSAAWHAVVAASGVLRRAYAGAAHTIIRPTSRRRVTAPYRRGRADRGALAGADGRLARRPL